MTACQRYIELNPVRAGMVEDPAQYRWSSYRSNALGQADDGLSAHEVYRQLGRDAHSREAAYRTLFRPALVAEAVDDIRRALQLGMPLGSDRFAEAVCARLGVRRNSGKRGRPLAQASGQLVAPAGQQDFGF